MKKIKKTLSVILCFAMLFSAVQTGAFAANAAMDGEVICQNDFESINAITDDTGFKTATVKRGTRVESWNSVGTSIEDTGYDDPADATAETGFTIASEEKDGKTNKYLTTSTPTIAKEIFHMFGENEKDVTDNEYYAYEFDIRINNNVKNAKVMLDGLSWVKSKITITTFMSFECKDDNTVQINLMDRQNDGYTSKIIPLKEWVNIRVEMKKGIVSVPNSTRTLDAVYYRVFVDGEAINNFCTNCYNSSGQIIKRFRGFGFRSGARTVNDATTQWDLDNIKFYKLSEITAIPVTSINIASAGETNQYLDSLSEVNFTASANTDISDPENVKWYVNDEEKGSGVAFNYTPDAAVGTYSVYAKYNDLQSQTVEIVVSDVQKLEKINVTYTGNIDQFEDSLSKIDFTAAGNIEISDPENIKWYVNDEEKGSGANFSYTPESFGTYEVWAVYGELASEKTAVNVIGYKDPTEAEFKDTTVFYTIGDSEPGVSSNDPKRLNKKSGAAIDADPADEQNKALKLTGTIGKSFIEPQRDFAVSARMYLKSPDAGQTKVSKHSVSFDNKTIATFTYDAQNLNYKVEISGKNAGCVPADKWFNFDLYITASANDDLAAAWRYAKDFVTITGECTNADGESVKNLTGSAVQTIDYSKIKSSMLFFTATNATAYYDDFEIYYPGSFALVKADKETYGEGYGLKLDGKINLEFNRTVCAKTYADNITVKDSDKNKVNANIYLKENNPSVIVVDFSGAKLNENSKYTIEMTDGLKDVTGRHLLDKTVSFETLVDPSDEAFLKELYYTADGSDTKITVPGFSDDIEKDTAYNALVDAGASKITLYARAANEASALVINPADGVIDLSDGSASATVSVTSADGSKTVVHTINFTVSDKKLVESITLSPTELEIWQDFAADLTLNKTVLPETAADKTVVFSSSDKSVADVDMTGKLILKGVGETVITATANDGSGVFAQMTLKVTEPVNRKENQKLNLDWSNTSRVDTQKYLSWPENVGDMQIAMWKNNASGAFTLTADDSIIRDFPAFIELYNQYKIPVTLFVPAIKYNATSGVRHYVRWQEADAVDGLSVQSHTYTHSDFTKKTTAEMAWDYKKGIDTIAQYVKSPQTVVAYASGNAGDISVARQFHIAGRGTTGTPNMGDKTNYLCTNSLSGIGTGNGENAVKTLYDSNYTVYGKSYVGGWTSVHFHGLVDNPSVNEVLAREKYGENATEEQLAEKFTPRDNLEYVYNKWLIPAVNEGKVWAALFADAAMYGQERDTAVLSIKEKTDTSYTFAITDEMDDSIFTYPLTVKIRIPDTWSEVSAYQSGEAVNVVIKEAAGKKYALVDAVPDKGDVKVSTKAVQTPQVSVTAQATAGSITANVNGGEDQNWQNIKTESFDLGTKIKLTAALADGETARFMYWKDDNSGTIVSYENSYEFTVGSEKSVTAVFAAEEEIYVTFRNINGRIQKAQSSADGNIVVPGDPFVYGYEFAGWFKDGVLQSIKAGDSVKAEKDTIYYAAYKEKSDLYKVSYNGSEKSYKYNSKVSLTAEQTKDNKSFSYWMRDGKIVSYNREYSFYVSADTTVSAVYESDVDEEIVLNMAEPVKVSDSKIAFFAERNVPSDKTVIETGILISKTAGLNLENALIKAGAKSTQNAGQFTVRKANVQPEETYYGRAYLIYKDASGVHTLYSNEVFMTL